MVQGLGLGTTGEICLTDAEIVDAIWDAPSVAKALPVYHEVMGLGDHVRNCVTCWHRIEVIHASFRKSSDTDEGSQGNT